MIIYRLAVLSILVLTVYVWTFDCFIIKHRTTIYKKAHLSSKARFIEGVDYIIQEDDNEKNTFNVNDQGEDEEKELTAIALLEEKLLNLAKKSELLAPTSNTYLEDMKKDGCVRINNAISQGLSTELATFITVALQSSILDVKHGKLEPLDRFSNMLSSENRWDIKLPVEDPMILNTMKTLLQQNTTLRGLLLDLVGENSELFEMAAFYTSSQAKRQCIHADTLWSKTPALYTVAVALQNISIDMGPTIFFPGSHTKTMHKKFDSARTKDNVIVNTPHKLSTLNIGDVSVYDSRVLHSGLPNNSDKNRILMYATFRNPKGPDAASDYWNVASIRPEYVGKYFLKDFL